jgi:hypothetical protein
VRRLARFQPEKARNGWGAEVYSKRKCSKAPLII